MAAEVGDHLRGHPLLNISEATAALPPQEKEKHASLDPTTLPTGKSNEDGNKGDAAPPSGNNSALNKKGEGVPTRDMGTVAAKEPKEEREEGRKKREAPSAQYAFVSPSKELHACANDGQLAEYIDWYGLQRDPIASLSYATASSPHPTSGSLAASPTPRPPCHVASFTFYNSLPCPRPSKS